MGNGSSTSEFTIGGQVLSVRWLLVSAAAAYATAVIAALVLGPLGVLICVLLATSTSAFLLGGLVLSFLARPLRGLAVLICVALVHVALIRAGVRFGLLWPFLSSEVLVWTQRLGF